MNVLMVQPRFEGAVVSGLKLHSIRPHRRDGKARARVGELLSVRVWTGKAYRSPQREIARVRVTEIEPIQVMADGVVWHPGTPARVKWSAADDMLTVLLHSLAHADGFTGWAEMRDWFEQAHGLPFQGCLIRWRNPPLSS